MYQPLKCFTYLSCIPLLFGTMIGLRFLYLIAVGEGYGHVQSLILACTLVIVGFLTFMIGLVSDLMAANRRILSDTQYHIRRMEYEFLIQQQNEEEESDIQWKSCMGHEKDKISGERKRRQKTFNMC